MTIAIVSIEDNAHLTDDLANAFEEMQAHYAVPCPPRAEVLAGLAARPAGTGISLAVEGDAVLGFATYAAIYPGPYLRPGLFLKELYVRRAHRGRGIGKLLIRQLAKIARQGGFSRIDWTADRHNRDLLSFYDRLGGERKEDKIFYRLEGEALEKLST